ncbi:hypothetical protein PENTCL1PPCAC_16447, partial [Pristionchus entomophagus]
LLTVADYERSATSLLPTQTRDYYNGGADDEWTLSENRRAFDDYVIRPFCLRDKSSCSLSTSFLSLPLSHPIGIAPTGYHGLAHPEGELATVRGAKASNSLMIASSFSTTPLENMKEAAGNHPMWMQLFVYTDRALTQSIIRRAETAGYSAFVLTVDYPTSGRRLKDIRNGFQLPSHLKNANFASISGAPAIQPFTWEFVQELVESTSLPVIVKGVMRAEDALKAIESGAKGIIVSNHGGRQLDSVPASIHVLKEIAEAV